MSLSVSKTKKQTGESMPSAGRKSLVAQAKALGIRVLKTDKDEDIALLVKDAVAKPGIVGFSKLSKDAVQTADRIRSTLDVINRLDDCFGFGFSSTSEACTERCPENFQCAELLIKREKALAEDTKLHAKAKAEHKGEEPFEPKPLLAYVGVVKQFSDRAKVEWLPGSSNLDKVIKKCVAAGVAPELMEALIEMLEELTTYGDVLACLEAASDTPADEVFSKLMANGFVKAI
jgi:hypothetical protein